MAYEQKDNSGTLFVNDRKEKDSQPDRTGTALIDGVEYWVSGWIKQGKNGQFLSIAFKRRDVQQPTHRQPSISERAMPKGPRYPDDRITTGRQDDSEIPF